MPPGNLCAVDGCTSRKRLNKNLSFFQLPVDEERRKKWVELIGRPDLASPDTNPRSHFVCSLHFEKSMIILKPQLRPNALPTKLLLAQPATSNSSTDTKTKETSTQTKYSTDNVLSAVTVKSADTKSKAAQTCDNSNTKETQTTASLSFNTPRKRLLSKSVA